MGYVCPMHVVGIDRILERVEIIGDRCDRWRGRGGRAEVIDTLNTDLAQWITSR